MKARQAWRQQGVTVVEGLIAMTVISITLGTALPSFQKAADRHRLEGGAAQLETELQYARNLAVTLNKGVRMSFQASGTQACYVVHTGPANACNCSGTTTTCAGGAEALRTVRFDAQSRMRATSNTSSLLFDQTKGTVTPTATIEMRNAQGDALRLVVNIMGRVRSCTPTEMPGYKRC